MFNNKVHCISTQLGERTFAVTKGKQIIKTAGDTHSNDFCLHKVNTERLHYNHQMKQLLC